MKGFRKEKKEFIDTDNSMMIIREKEGWGR